MVNVLVIGGNGREHAICWKLSTSSKVDQIFVTPGSYGTSVTHKVMNVVIDIKNSKELCKWANDHKVKLVIVGPEEPLASGIIDTLQESDILGFGPTKSAARIESDKEWAKDFMVRHGIPTARYKCFTEAQLAKDFIASADFKALVVKASGLAAGKGVIVAENNTEACAAVDLILTEKKFGKAGTSIVVEELFEGVEVSVLGFSDGSIVYPMLPAHDYKRLLDDDKGSNTGGMGTYCPSSFLDTSQLQEIVNDILQRAVDGLKKENCPFIGVLYAGLMLTSDGPKVLEFNCRFGDPEAEVILPLLKNDLFEVMMACCNGKLNTVNLEWEHNLSAVGVVMAAKGYPESPRKGDLITGLELASSLPGILTFHSGIAKTDVGLVTNGGRVVINVCLAPSLVTAAAKATQACSVISFEGAQYRRDIAHRGIPRWILRKGELTYKLSGVDISAGNRLVSLIKSLVQSTRRPGVLNEIGSFGSLFDSKLAGHVHPLLVAGADGVGTKLKVAQSIGDHSTIGIDLVAMSVNDILCQGGEPLFFLDYFACGKLDASTTASVVEGIAKGCILSGCALVGGETAELPDMYEECIYDIAGFAVGAVEEGQELPLLSRLVPGDVVIALPSTGLHSNGFSLVRKVLNKLGIDYTSPAPFSNKSIGEELLTPTKIYVKEVLPLIRQHYVKAVAHITGGGLLENIPRVIRNDLKVVLDAHSWNIPPIFPWLALNGEISEQEMLRTFNCGVGLILITSFEKKFEVKHKIEGAVMIGEVMKREEGESQVVVNNFMPALESHMKPYVSSIVEKVINMKRLAVLISGTGTDLQSLIDAIHVGKIDGEIVLVISNKTGVQGLERAQKAGIPTKVIPHGQYSTREDFEKEVNNRLVEFGVELVVLAGFMRVLTNWFVSRWRGKLINVHPALLPLFPGLHTHKRALEAGMRVTGCTVHFVEEDVDAGGIIVQEAVNIEGNDTEDTLQERVKIAEHRALPKAVQLLCTGKARLDLETGKVIFN